MKYSLSIIISLFLMCTLYAQQTDTLKVNSRENLNTKEESIVSISALTAKSDYPNLKSAINVGLDAGLTVNEISEIMIHLYAYCGFPKSIRGLQTFMEVLDERKEKGITDEIGKEASPLNDDRSKYDRGKENLENLIGMPLTGPQRGYAQFAPAIEVFLKEHLFADIFDRDILTYAERELVTVSVLSSIGGVEPMLRSHLNICIYQGYTQRQLQQFISIIESTIGKEEASKAQIVLDEVLKSRQSE